MVMDEHELCDDCTINFRLILFIATINCKINVQPKFHIGLL